MFFVWKTVFSAGFFKFCNQKRSFLQKEALGLVLLSFLCFFVFSAWIQGPTQKAGSGATKRPASCSNWFSRVRHFCENRANIFNIWNGDLNKNAIKIGFQARLPKQKICQNDPLESRSGAHKRAGSGSTYLTHFLHGGSLTGAWWTPSPHSRA